MTDTHTKKYDYILSFTKYESDIYYCLLHKRKWLAEGRLPCSVLAFNGLLSKLQAYKVDLRRLACCVERRYMGIFPLVFVARHNFTLHVLSLPPQKRAPIATQKDRAQRLARHGYQQQDRYSRHLISPTIQYRARCYWRAKQHREEIEAIYSRFDQKLAKITQLIKEAHEDAANAHFFVVEDVF